MPRGSNSSIEQERIQAGERFNSSRGNGKTDAGVKSHEKKGFGSEKGMQQNPKRPAAPKF